MSIFESSGSGRRDRAVRLFLLLPLAVGLSSLAAWKAATGLPHAPEAPADPCERPPIGSAVPEPADVRSVDGTLKVDLTIRNHREPDGSTRYCYTLPDGRPSPTLRVRPGDWVELDLKNALSELPAQQTSAQTLDSGPMCTTKPQPSADPCSSGAMTAVSTNLHFHGLTVPPACHQDDVLKTSIQPSDAPFEYRFQVPEDEAPGMYWYHPHIHGFSAKQVSGGASGALIVEGLERANPVVAGLPERVLVIRDHDLLNPDAPPAAGSDVPKPVTDRDGDTANTGTGLGRPARDLSINFVSVPYPDYPPASIVMKPGERQLWRVLNASAITYLDLAVLYQHRPQQLGVVAIDGGPINAANIGKPRISGFNHLSVPPGARVEFIVTGPPLGVPAELVSMAVDTGPGGENDPGRALATITAQADAAEPSSTLPASSEPLPVASRPWLGTVEPVRERKLYFSEEVQDPNDPNSPTRFFITVEGQTPTEFDPNASMPNIVVKQGDVEDWVIENRTNELHAFHIHQLHFQVMDWLGAPVNEPFLRDTVNVPYFNGRANEYPSVRLRMDFRDPNAVGTFLFHCHLLEHEDGGMMGTIRVEPAATSAR
jgi:FtsP/CotA-like multicopper oxidase with cupredoxin domain